MVKVTMTNDLFRDFLVKCNPEDALKFKYEVDVSRDIANDIEANIKNSLGEDAQNEKATTNVTISRDDFNVLRDRVSGLEKLVDNAYENLDIDKNAIKAIQDRLDQHEMRLSAFGSKFDRLDEKVDNIHDQQKALINAVNAYASNPIDVFKLQEQANRLRPSQDQVSWKYDPGAGLGDLCNAWKLEKPAGSPDLCDT